MTLFHPADSPMCHIHPLHRKPCVLCARAGITEEERDGWREKWLNDKGIRDELIAELLVALKLAQPEFCSMKCPSVFRGPDSARHLPECVAMTAAIFKAENR